MLVAWLLAQQAAGTDASLIGYGVAAPFLGWLIWQLRTDRAAYKADVDDHRRQLDIERQANRELYDRIIAQQERLGPILERAARALEHSAETT